MSLRISSLLIAFISVWSLDKKSHEIFFDDLKLAIINQSIDKFAVLLDEPFMVDLGLGEDYPKNTVLKQFRKKTGLFYCLFFEDACIPKRLKGRNSLPTLTALNKALSKGKLTYLGATSDHPKMKGVFKYAFEYDKCYYFFQADCSKVCKLISVHIQRLDDDDNMCDENNVCEPPK